LAQRHKPSRIQTVLLLRLTESESALALHLYGGAQAPLLRRRSSRRQHSPPTLHAFGRLFGRLHRGPCRHNDGFAWPPQACAMKREVRGRSRFAREAAQTLRLWRTRQNRAILRSRWTIQWSQPLPPSVSGRFSTPPMRSRAGNWGRLLPARLAGVNLGRSSDLRMLCSGPPEPQKSEVFRQVGATESKTKPGGLAESVFVDPARKVAAGEAKRPTHAHMR
jgi:hypothetical protein